MHRRSCMNSDDSSSGAWVEDSSDAASFTEPVVVASVPPDTVGADDIVYKFVPCHSRKTDDDELSSSEGTTAVQLAVVGDAGVGKTSILGTFVQRHFQTNTRATIGVDFLHVWLKSNAPHWDRRTSVSLIDCAGQERFQDILPQKLRSPYGILLVFDTTNRKTFDSLTRWSDKIGQYNEHCCRMLVGNKMDLYRELPEESQWMRHVNWDQAQRRLLCDEGRFFVSAKEVDSVDSMLVEMVDCAVERQEDIMAEQEQFDRDEQRRNQRYTTSNHIVNLSISQQHSNSRNTNCKC